MDYHPLELTVISAKDIKDTNLIGKQDPYGVVWLSNDTKNKQKTPIHQDGGTNPSWNHTVRFNVDVNAARNGGIILHVLLRCEKPFGDKDVGEVVLPVEELLDTIDSKSAQFVSYQVRTSSGKSKGVLNLSYKFADLVAAHQYRAQPAAQPTCCSDFPPVCATKSDAHAVPYAFPYAAPGAYPPPRAPGAYPPPPAPGQPYPPGPPPPVDGYPPGPPPPAGYHSGAYPPPPPPGACPQPGAYPPPPGSCPPGYGYGYPSQPYGYPPAVPVLQPQQPAKKNKFGLGLGAGLLGGAIGGLILGDMIGDAAETSFDGGFDF